MKALCLVEPYKVEVQERPVPDAGRGEALVRVLSVSLCGSDIHAYHGRQAIFDYPRIIGHEICGVIEKLDGGSGALRAGDKVVAIPYISCGSCVACRKGKPGCCATLSVYGVHRDGGLAEFVVVPEEYLVKVDPDMDSARAALIEPYAIGAHAVHNLGVDAGDTVLVLGAGPIGLGAAEIAKSHGGRVILADVNADRRAFAGERFGYEHVLNPAEDGFADVLSRLTGGDFADSIIDATGNAESMGNSFRYLGMGGKVVFVGISKGNIVFNNLEFYKRQTELYGSRAATRFDFEYVIKTIDGGGTDPLKFVTHRVAFDDAMVERFVELMGKGGEVFKAVVDIAQ